MRPGQRPGSAAGAGGEDLGALFHHQARGRGHGAGPGHLPPDRGVPRGEAEPAGGSRGEARCSGSSCPCRPRCGPWSNPSRARPRGGPVREEIAALPRPSGQRFAHHVPQGLGCEGLLQEMAVGLGEDVAEMWVVRVAGGEYDAMSGLAFLTAAATSTPGRSGRTISVSRRSKASPACPRASFPDCASAPKPQNPKTPKPQNPFDVYSLCLDI